MAPNVMSRARRPDGRLRPMDPLVALMGLLIVVVFLAFVSIANRSWVAAAGEGEVSGRTVTRTYMGNAKDTAAAFRRDAAKLGGRGYYPISQSYTPGSWGCGAFLIALLLCILLIGILIFIYMLVVKPAGTLVVTYEYRPPQPARAPIAPPPREPAPDPAAVLASLASMRDQGLIAAEEYEAKKADLLAKM